MAQTTDSDAPTSVKAAPTRKLIHNGELSLKVETNAEAPLRSMRSSTRVAGSLEEPTSNMKTVMYPACS